MIRRFQLPFRTHRDDDGVAMITVIGAAMILTILAVAGVTYALGTTRQARDDQDWNGALAAAFAGVEEYQSRLANNPGYQAFGNPASPFSVQTHSAVVLPESHGGAVNPAFSLTSWASVPGSGGNASYRYEVDNSKYYADGTLRLRASGRVGEEVRTVIVDLRQKGFLDFLYFTDFETQDPLVSSQTTDTTAMCSVYSYNGRNSACTTIQFGGFDEINGPLHSNDTLFLCGSPRFLGMTTSSYQPTSGLRYKKPSSCGLTTTPFFQMNGSQPGWQGITPMPQTNAELKKETRLDLPEVENPGCLYTGPTSIVFNADGTMTVRSPWTKYTSPSATNNTKCGTPGTSGLGKSTGQTIPVPDGTVIYVQNVPSTSSDPNYWPASGAGVPTCATNGNSLGYPLTNEKIRYTGAYGCRNGDTFVKGTLDGHVTIGSENYIYVTDNITYEDSGEDILGLVGQNAVWVWNPVNGSDATMLSGTNRRIDAAILSVAHTFMVQNYDAGSARGTLTVNGAIAQKFRGTVATSSSGGSIVTGYAKDYNYDLRFRTTGPPKFLAPAAVNYGITTYVEVEPAFSA